MLFTEALEHQLFIHFLLREHVQLPVAHARALRFRLLVSYNMRRFSYSYELSVVDQSATRHFFLRGLYSVCLRVGREPKHFSLTSSHFKTKLTNQPNNQRNKHTPPGEQLDLPCLALVRFAELDVKFPVLDHPEGLVRLAEGEEVLLQEGRLVLQPDAQVPALIFSLNSTYLLSESAEKNPLPPKTISFSSITGMKYVVFKNDL